MRSWDRLPQELRTEEVRPYYVILKGKPVQRFVKRGFDIVMSALMLIVFSPLFLVLAALVGLGSKGGVFFRQVRVTRYGKQFRIVKFRTMVKNAEKLGTQVTVGEDARITGIGRFLRKYRLDELPQLFNVLIGQMSFVGTRPEVVRYVDHYTDQMKATLLQSAGITSVASIRYKDEDKILGAAEDPERAYIEQVLPQKMKYNLEQLRSFGLINDISTMIKTVTGVLKRGEQ
ncbi:MAG: sugar transferase [Eubacteriales bacterium]|nr:sugar transferase [Eubacteriales bacterium]